MNLRAEHYRAAEHKELWDAFVARARNGSFLFFRDYMDYHSDRFSDRSLMFFEGPHPVALLPLSERDGVLSSHGGLSFGGIVSDSRVTTAQMLEIFRVMRQTLVAEGATSVIYKPVPHIYHLSPAEEELYALFRARARLIRRDVSSALTPQAPGALSKGRKWALGKARGTGVVVQRTEDFDRFFAIERALLAEKYGVEPVHSAAEMTRLASRFPRNIHLYAAYHQDEMEAGVLVYESERVAHTQYIASTENGRELFALDSVIHRLMTDTYAAKPIFDFGISTEKNGWYLNAGLIKNKESWGARAVAYDWYQLDLTVEWELEPA